MFSSKHKVAFNAQTVYEGHHKVTYRGVKAIKCPFDYVLYQMLIWKLQPDLIIEIGTNKGGSALYLADLLSLTGKGEVHTIDIVKDQADELAKNHPRIRMFIDGYAGYDLSLASGFNTILVIEDGSHSYTDTLGAMKKFAPIVTPGSYLIVEDGIINELGMKKHFDGGPLRAIDEFLPTHPGFTIDREYCDMFGTNATFNVSGFLKKQK
jgi:cephalosporin hydroxylase